MTIAVFLGALLGAMALGMPIAYALIICGVALMAQLSMFDAQIIAQNLINGADSFPLMAVPFFMLAGEVMNVGGLSKRIIDLAMALVGHIRGGLGYVTIVAACILSALSGSAVADAAALSALLVPMMVGVAANLSITKLFLAGIMPGIYIAAGLWFAWWWEVRKEKLAPPAKSSLADVMRALRSASWALVLPFIIIFGLKFGIFTPTEAAVVAAVYSLFVAVVVYRELSLKRLYAVFLSAAMMTSVVMFLVAAALVSAWLITVADLPSKVVGLLEPFMGNKTLLMFAMMVLVLIVGTAMDMTPTILILTPVLMPLVKAAGIDPIYFGVLFIVNNSIGLITPPVGVVLNVVAGVSKISMEDVMRGVWPFMLAETAVLLLMVVFPPLVTIPAKWFAG